jgi:exodeoxyribonuclease VIII
VSKSVLDRVAISPAHARAYLDGQRTETTPAMAFGTALHAAVLEPEQYAQTYVTFSGDRRTKQGKEDYAALQASGATIIDSSDAERIAAMSEAIRRHPLFVDEGMHEASVFDTDEATGLAVKARPDVWIRERGVVFDLKTTEDASPAGFARSVARYRYHVQAAHYMALTGASRFVFFAVEKAQPFCVAAYELDADALSVGRALRDRDLAAMASALEFNTWPGYPAQITTISLPRWAAMQEVE